MACHAQLYTGSLLLAHPATLVDYIYITAAKLKTMMDCLEAWFCHLGCLFDTLVISSFQSLFQPWISLNLGICPQTLSLVAKVYASDFSPRLPWSWGGRNHFFWGAHPNAVFGTRQHFWLTAGIFLKQRKKQQGQELLQRGLAPGALEIPADLRCTLLWWAHFFGCMLHISVLKYPEDSSYGLYPHCQYSRAHGKKMASLRPASAIWQAPSQPGLYSKTLSQTKQNKSLWKSGKQIVELM